MHELDDENKDAYTECRRLIKEFFRIGNNAEAWFFARNPLLGNVSPKDYMEIKGPEKLLKFIKQRLSENEREI